MEIIVPVVVLGVLLVVVVVGVFVWWRLKTAAKMRNMNNKPEEIYTTFTTNKVKVNDEEEDDELECVEEGKKGISDWEIKMDELEFLQMLGEGYCHFITLCPPHSVF